jgi:hypothetical protein
MYGLVNQAIRDLIIRDYGEILWERICEKAAVSTVEFTPLQSYPDSLTYQLIQTAATELGLETAKLLHDLGVYWITFTADEGYGDLMNMFGKNLRTCLKNLNRMHSHMGAMMPELEPPRFIVEELAPNRILVHYYSTRPGLAPMVIGLLEGLAQKFGEQIHLKHVVKSESSDHETFEVEFDVSQKQSK